MSLTILADENIPAVEHHLGAFGTVRRVNGRTLQRAQLTDVDVLLVRSVSRVDETLLHGSAVKFVGTATSGTDHIDRDYLHSRGIGFAYAPGSNANSVVEYVLAAIAAVEGVLERLLDGGIVGIVGYGVIGQAVSARLRALGIASRACDPWLDQNILCNPVSLEQVLDSDVVTLHAELTREQPWPSFHLLGETELAAIRGDALLINASRGAVVDNVALVHLLQQGAGPAAVLDVWEGEPAIDPTLLQCAALGTPHIAGYSLDGKLLATRMLGDALAQHFDRPIPAWESPVAVAQMLEIDDPLTGAALLRHLLQQRYDIHRDDARLRAATYGTAAADAATGFDLLRCDYPERRELAGSMVRGAFQSQRDIELVRGLGCEPVVTGSAI